jgi:hypothetical protein
MSGANGDGEANGAEGAAPPTPEEALAAFGEPRDRIDRIAVFVATQAVNMAKMIELQAQGLADLLKLQSSTMTFLAERIVRLEAEVARLGEATRDTPSDDGKETLQ